MRRTRAIRLALLGTVGLVGLAACDDGNPLGQEGFFQTETECAKSNNPDACRQAIADARAEHLKTAPAFASREACEAKFGAENCMETKEKPGQVAEGAPAAQTASAAGGGSWFMPMMMGFMMGNMMGGRSAQPVYRDTTNTAYSGGRPVGTFKDHALPPPRSTGSVAGVPTRSPAGTNTTRGGFGTSSTGSSGSSGS